MTKVPSIGHIQLIHALQRAGWIVVRQRGSHIRLQKRVANEMLKLTVPAHHPIKRSTLSHLLKQAHLTVDDLLKLL
ncbi:MAG: type II toxin-antitoxin system HicA family toxin [Candidatus Aminicenantes bacterium]|nr:type II toxin-antitoxin system HicA family toxin [Candidatus Aminicenantes bacterium]